MNVLVETGALAPLGNNRQSWLRHTTHEEEDVGMTRLPTIQPRKKKN